jgi:hypothetical protein
MQVKKVTRPQGETAFEKLHAQQGGKVIADQEIISVNKNHPHPSSKRVSSGYHPPFLDHVQYAPT